VKSLKNSPFQKIYHSAFTTLNPHGFINQVAMSRLDSSPGLLTAELRAVQSEFFKLKWILPAEIVLDICSLLSMEKFS
jgi:hypothetical protein